QQEGRGDDLVLLHGWGLHGGIWDPIVPALARDWRVTRIDLPGHGRSPWPDQGAPSLDELMSGLVAAAPRRAVWLGWSLGGMLALRLAARLPQRVRGLVLVAATPKFVEGPDWPHGMERTLLEDFRNALENDYARTLMRFLALQSRPGDHAAQEMRVLRRAVFAHGHPQREGLSFGLRLLEEMDLRRELTAVQCSSLWVTGDRDVLVPHEAAQAAA
ncbi:MAG: pimeloyl-ACP methyl ester esterase BioH, partial [Gammaproteobacteria bacterium]|nr:pimeloyl-ACP methyl ester esterase BioH [Gammaproteobacteria bacterium]NIR97351.1 pimeloyl-ACP methyl ester esterase BioH [Gammaproteobacteria bacterium]NIT64110.1 pimeloyl-ACP methyl ester esterase BioH [Gammaproteobacteria bacterium]NIV21040.1 pimeloyl-ACP methyl ester esterase BioH [Gammaproteobacteria bacterium]NIY32690.1 pimeloyl-ACP methyl ester esterase BioH [Gammaproteobacteria bacterium]